MNTIFGHMKAILAVSPLVVAVLLSACGGGDSSAPAPVTTTVPRFAYVANSGNDTISMYAVDSATGQFHYTGHAAAGDNPVSVTVDPTGRFAYAANSNSDNVSVYTIDQATGALTALAGAAGTIHALSSPRSIALASGSTALSFVPKFAYAANDGSTNVSVYTINPTSGALTEVGTPVAAVMNPKSVTVDPTGKFAYVANESTNNVSVYTINPPPGR